MKTPPIQFSPRALFVLDAWRFGFAFFFAATLPSFAVAPALQLNSVAQVDRRRNFSPANRQSSQPLPAVKLCDAPAFGKTTELTRAQVNDLIAAAAPNLATTNWTGADSIRISRRSHEFSENEMLALLTKTLQHDYVKDRGELELDLTQPWTRAGFAGRTAHGENSGTADRRRHAVVHRPL